MAITIPYVIAEVGGGNTFHFVGFLINPLDGNSYLAKMQEGWSGSWTFNLLYSPQSSGGAYIFLFYIFLGHLTRWTSLPLILVFHLFRIFATWFFLFELKLFLEQLFCDDPGKSEKAFIWIVFGTGLGWVAILFGLQTSDLWVAEAYPFLACYANPHFPLALALILCVLRVVEQKLNGARLGLSVICGLLLGIILPFGVVIAGLIILITTIWNWIAQNKLSPWQLIGFGAGGLPPLLYQLYVVNINPELLLWNQQNLTPAPPLWDFIISFSPAIILTVIGVVVFIKNKEMTRYKTILIWFLVGTILTFVPFALQRRFMLGLYIPIVALAVMAISSIVKSEIWRRRITKYSMIASIFTSLLVLIIGMFGVLSHSSMYYLTRNQYDALIWIKNDNSKEVVILADPQISMYIPGMTGQRVVYGHPYESVHAEEQKRKVEDFFSGKLPKPQTEQLIEANQVKYILREGSENIGLAVLTNAGFAEVIKFGEITLYKQQ